jgi:hypothetical protein
LCKSIVVGVAVILTLLGALYLLVVYKNDEPDRRFRLAFNSYPHSELVYEGVLRGNGYYSVNTRVLIYWTSDLFDAVQKYHFIDDERLLVHIAGDHQYYISDSMLADRFRRTTTGFSHDICAHLIDPQELTTLNIYFLTANATALSNLAPMDFGCAADVHVSVPPDISFRDEGTYIIVGYNVLAE